MQSLYDIRELAISDAVYLLEYGGGGATALPILLIYH